MRIRLFFSSLALTLLLVLPMAWVAQYLSEQRQIQEEIRQANAAASGVGIEQMPRYDACLLLAVQREEPAFFLLRVNAAASRLTICGLPGAMQLTAPSGTTTLADAYLAAGPARAAQLLKDTTGTAVQAYLAATPACWMGLWNADTMVRLDTAPLLSAAARADLGLADSPVVQISTATAETAVPALAKGQTSEAAAQIYAAFAAELLRQNPQQLDELPARAREESARTLTDLSAQDWNGMEQAFAALAASAAFAVEQAVPEFSAQPGGALALTQAGQEAVRTVLTG